MATEGYRGVVRGGKVVLQDGPAALPDGTEVVVTPVAPPGTGAAVLAALAAGPPVDPAWVEELEQAIAGGARPPGSPISGPADPEER